MRGRRKPTAAARSTKINPPPQFYGWLVYCYNNPPKPGASKEELLVHANGIMAGCAVSAGAEMNIPLDFVLRVAYAFYLLALYPEATVLTGVELIELKRALDRANSTCTVKLDCKGEPNALTLEKAVLMGFGEGREEVMCQSCCSFILNRTQLPPGGYPKFIVGEKIRRLPDTE